MKVALAYGQAGLDVDLPDDRVAAVLEASGPDRLGDPAAAVRACLRCPTTGPALCSVAEGAQHVCIVTCDHTRPAPNRLVVAALLEELGHAGIADEQVELLIATGTHRQSTRDEIRASLGEDLVQRVRVRSHVATDEASHVRVGVVAGIGADIDRGYVNADLRLTVGLIEPHFMAGFSGGRKLVMPGIASQRATQEWHSPRLLEHPRASAGVLPGNPVHETATAIAALCPPHFTVDVLLDRANGVAGVFAGRFPSAWEAGAAACAEHAGDHAPCRCEVVVTTCAGYPLDATYYQAVKGMVGALPLLAPGGTLIVAAACSEGIGSESFRQLLFGCGNLSEFVERIQQQNWRFQPDQWEVEELAKAAAVADIVLVCHGIPDHVVPSLFARPAASVEAAVAEALDKHGPGARIGVIPRGPYVLPQVTLP